MLNKKLGLGTDCPTGISFYVIQPHKSLRVIFADGYDISVLGWPPGHPSHEAAVALLAEKNPNQNKNMPEGLVGLERRFVQFGGGATQCQLDWIRDEITEAAGQGQKVSCLLLQRVTTGSFAGSCKVLFCINARAIGASRDAACVHYFPLAGACHLPPWILP